MIRFFLGLAAIGLGIWVIANQTKLSAELGHGVVGVIILVDLIVAVVLLFAKRSNDQ